MIGCFAWNIYRITTVYNRPESQQTATERQDSILRSRHSLNNKQTIEIYEDKNLPGYKFDKIDVVTTKLIHHRIFN